MARIRSVKPNLFGSYSIARVPIEARYLFVGLFCEADDEGRLIDSPKRIAGSIFPHDDKVTDSKVNRWLNHLQGEHMVYRYTVDGGRFMVIPKWATHQKVSHPLPSALPPPTGAALAEFLSGSGTALENDGSAAGLNGKGKGN